MSTYLRPLFGLVVVILWALVVTGCGSNDSSGQSGDDTTAASDGGTTDETTTTDDGGTTDETTATDDGGTTDGTTTTDDGGTTDETCLPDCEGKSCGDNGCGESCGECEDGNLCYQGQCVIEGPCGLEPTCECVIVHCFPKVTAEAAKSDCLKAKEANEECLTVQLEAYLLKGCGTHCANKNTIFKLLSLYEVCTEPICKETKQEWEAGEPTICENCLCTQQCDLINCGKDEDDGCGGKCDCAEGSICKSGTCTECTPSCENKECGSNGCNGSCGNCEPGFLCKGGQCKCIQQCDGKSCGDDGCGGTCGQCFSNGECVDGKCVCEPFCGDKKCGSNGCGGSCGQCGPNQSCNANGQCAEVCTPKCGAKKCGPDGCGSICGKCDSGSSCENGQCIEPSCITGAIKCSSCQKCDQSIALCIDKAGDGEACQGNADCLNNSCKFIGPDGFGKCTSLVTGPSNCSKATDCKTACTFCLTLPIGKGVCASKKTQGVGCKSSVECISAKCSGGTCK
ncbi:MAG TPA: hypothetical protein EYN06_02225 [Myxococcales bacterium]|nr:hypothetical protein [Myxococcales bacterium]